MILDKSGSCAIVVLIVGDICYTANVGDSRAILSTCGSSSSLYSSSMSPVKQVFHAPTVFALSRDHKPSDEQERKRIIEAGGQIYQTATTITSSGKNTSHNPEGDINAHKEMIIGPQRVLPGRLSVSRTFGDLEAKMAALGGNPRVVVAMPEINKFRIDFGEREDCDYIVMGSDGIFDKLSNEEVAECVWMSVRDVNKESNLESSTPVINVHKQIGMGVEYVIKNALLRRSLDNVTVVVIAFEGFQRKLANGGSNNL